MHDIFYFTDVHGMYDLYKAAIDYCKEQDPEAMIIFGGDACDRGPDGYKIMKELLDNPKVLYLKGNHEDMFVQAAYAIAHEYKGALDYDNIFGYLYDQEIRDYGNPYVQSCIYNGGFSTLRDWMKDGMPRDIIDRIDHLPITFSYDNIDFCHAGGYYFAFKRVADDEYEDMQIDKDDFMDTIWDRFYLTTGWQSGRICVFGHTPTIHLQAIYYGKDKSLENAHPCAYIGRANDRWTGKKIDMDTGAFASGKLYVLNVLTMQAQGFKDTDIGNEEIRKHDIEKIEVIQF